MRSNKRGKHTLAPEITHVSTNGVWLLHESNELFMPFDEFPFFLDASIRELHNVVAVTPTHLRWPALDVDLDIKSIQTPPAYPLVDRVRTARKSRTALGSSRK